MKEESLLESIAVRLEMFLVWETSVDSRTRRNDAVINTVGRKGSIRLFRACLTTT